MLQARMPGACHSRSPPSPSGLVRNRQVLPPSHPWLRAPSEARWGKVDCGGGGGECRCFGSSLSQHEREKSWDEDIDEMMRYHQVATDRPCLLCCQSTARRTRLLASSRISSGNMCLQHTAVYYVARSLVPHGMQEDIDLLTGLEVKFPRRCPELVAHSPGRSNPLRHLFRSLREAQCAWWTVVGTRSSF